MGKVPQNHCEMRCTKCGKQYKVQRYYDQHIIACTMPNKSNTSNVNIINNVNLQKPQVVEQDPQVEKKVTKSISEYFDYRTLVVLNYWYETATRDLGSYLNKPEELLIDELKSRVTEDTIVAVVKKCIKRMHEYTRGSNKITIADALNKLPKNILCRICKKAGVTCDITSKSSIILYFAKERSILDD